MHDIRVIVLNYKRPENVQKIIDAYKNIFPVTVINNNPDQPFPYLGQPIDVINNEENFYCMERWVRCFDYDEPYKFVLDDDLIVDPSSIIRMRKKRQHAVGIYGKSGVSKSTNYQSLSDHWCVDSEVDFLVGSGILIRQEKLDDIKEYIDRIGYPIRGDDIIISYFLKKYCGSRLSTTAAKVINLPEGNSGLNTNPNHFALRWKVVEKFKNIGW
jgi:hypothetical protein